MYVYTYCNALSARFFAVDRALLFYDYDYDCAFQSQSGQVTGIEIRGEEMRKIAERFGGEYGSCFCV